MTDKENHTSPFAVEKGSGPRGKQRSRDTVIDQDRFDRMLAWLGKDREAAGEKYEHIRQSLIKIFTWRGCSDPEDMADQVVDRVSVKVEGLAPKYIGDPALYFYGVAKKLIFEHQRSEKRRVPLPEIAVNENYLQQKKDTLGLIYECLSLCMQGLKPAEADLFIEYYSCDHPRKIDKRKSLAQRIGVGTNALRVRVHRIRATLEDCINRCLEPAV